MVELNEKITACKLSAGELSSCSKINYYAARRYLIRGVKKRNNSALKLCTYFNISTEIPNIMQCKELMKVLETVEDVWDGTTIHAEFIDSLIRSTKSYKVEGRRVK